MLPLLAHAAGAAGVEVSSAGCDSTVPLPHDDKAPVHVSDDAASSMPDDGGATMPLANRNAGKAPVVVSCGVVVASSPGELASSDEPET